MVTLEAAEACTLAVEDSTAAAVPFMAEDMVAATMADTAATTPVIQEAATAVVGPMQARAAVMEVRTVLQQGIPGLGRATARAIRRRDGISFLLVMEATWVAPEPQLPLRELRHPKQAAIL